MCEGMFDENGAPDFTALQAALPVSARFRPSSHSGHCRRGGLDPVQDARTGFRRAREDGVLDRIAIHSPNSPPRDERQLARQRPKSQVPTFTYDFPRQHQWPPNDGCGAQISPSQTSLDPPPVAILAKRGSLLSDRDLICHFGSVAMMAVTAAN
jgi:hypothetical protein